MYYVCRFLSGSKLPTHLGKYKETWIEYAVRNQWYLPKWFLSHQQWEFLLLYMLTSIWCVSVLDFSYSNRHGILLCCFNLQFSSDVWYLLCIYWYDFYDIYFWVYQDYIARSLNVEPSGILSINPTWLWYIIIFIHCWVRFLNILLRISVLFMRDVGLWFICLCLVLLLG